MTSGTSRIFESKDLPPSFADRPAQTSGVQVRERNGIWEVSDNGVFRGDYHQEDHALAAAELLRVSQR